MRKELKLFDRLIIDTDFEPGTNGHKRVRSQVLKFADKIHGTGVYLSVGPVLHGDYSLIGEIQSRGLKVCANLKLIGSVREMSYCGVFLREAKPDMVTVMCAGSNEMRALKAELPDTEVIGVTHRYGQTMFNSLSGDELIRDIADSVEISGIDGIVCWSRENSSFRSFIDRAITINNLGICPIFAVPSSNQSLDRSTTTQAIYAGADRIVVDHEILLPDPKGLVLRILGQIQKASYDYE